jgi:hypothetical protein
VTTVRIKGGPELKARLAAIPAGAPELVALWADDAASRMRSAAPNARRPASRQFTTKARGLRAAVYGAFWWIFVDRGTKAHDIYGSGGKNPPDTLKFEYRGRTVFAKKVHRRGKGRRAFISKAAQDALASSALTGFIIKQWNKRRIGGAHKSFL